MADLKLRRIEHLAEGVFSELKTKDLEVIAHTVEHAYGDMHAPKLPDGEYTCKRGVHQLAHGKPFETFEIENVPGHDHILFHTGNWGQVDSEGCVLLGIGVAQSRQGKMVTQSKQAFEEFMKLQEGVSEFKLIVES